MGKPKIKKVMTGKEVLRLLLSLGWEIDNTEGDHYKLVKDGKKATVVYTSKDLKPKTLDSILKQAGLK